MIPARMALATLAAGKPRASGDDPPQHTPTKLR